ncbi:MAG: SGNH/GDSL hydrolase family protein [Micromonosporaceae bacterium]
MKNSSSTAFHRLLSLIVVATALVGAVAAGPVTASEAPAAKSTAWAGAWGAAEQPPTGPSFQGPNWSELGFANHSIRQVVRVSAGGSQLRIRLSNVYGERPLQLTGATIGAAGEGAAVIPSTIQRLTFSGRAHGVAPAGEMLVSDPVSLTTAPLQRLSVTLYVAQPTGPATFHEAASATAYRAVGDHRSNTDGTPYLETSHSWYYLNGVEVSGRQAPRDTVVAFGDSITDGVSSTPDADNRYPDELAERLVAADRPMGVVNAGISGNRVLNDSPCFGEKATARFNRDVLARPGVRSVIVLEGINDIQAHMAPFLTCFAPHDEVTAAQLIAGHRALIRAAHARGVRIIGATITPYQGSWFYTDQGEAVRDTVNHWIRTSGEYDAVVDLDRVLADPENPDQLRPAYDAGDKLHPNDAGLHAMAEAVDLDSL